MSSRPSKVKFLEVDMFRGIKPVSFYSGNLGVEICCPCIMHGQRDFKNPPFVYKNSPIEFPRHVQVQEILLRDFEEGEMNFPAQIIP